jgi:hypothetical protein
MIRIVAALLGFASSAALADDRIPRAIVEASEMFVAGRPGACPNLRLDMNALVAMLEGQGLQVQDIRPGGKYHGEMQMAMVEAALRYSADPALFCASAAEVYAAGELRK